MALSSLGGGEGAAAYLPGRSMTSELPGVWLPPLHIVFPPILSPAPVWGRLSSAHRCPWQAGVTQRHREWKRRKAGHGGGKQKMRPPEIVPDGMDST